jgi:HlyD family secretion protein
MFVLAAIVATTSVVGVVVYFFFFTNPSVESGPMIHVVERGTFVHTVTERGSIESSNNVEVRCEVKSRGMSGVEIIYVIDEGTIVEADEKLVQLDSSRLEIDRDTQQIVVNKNHASVIKSKNLYEGALIAKKEYVEGTFAEKEQELMRAVFVAEEDLRRAREYARYSERLAAKGYATELQLTGDRFAVEKARKELEAARTKLMVLREYTYPKQLKVLDSDIATSKAALEADEETYQLELEELQEIDRQIANCTIVAPEPGRVVYANRSSHRGMGSDFVVEEGAVVRERQVIIRLPDSTQMQVRTNINETKIGFVKEGMRATIWLGSQKDEEPMTGTVTHVNEYPEPTWHSSGPRDYKAYVEIDNPPASLRTGLTAKVEIYVKQLDDVLHVPVQAVYLHGGRYYVFEQNGVEWTAEEVELGATNDESVVIEKGVREGDRIAMNPEMYLDRVDLPELTDEHKNGNGLPRPSEPRPNPSTDNDEQRDDESSPSDRKPSQSSTSGRPNAGGGPANVFTQFDADKDGKLSKDEAPGPMKNRFDEVDANKDGFVSRGEMSAAMKKSRDER